LHWDIEAAIERVCVYDTYRVFNLLVGVLTLRLASEISFDILLVCVDPLLPSGSARAHGMQVQRYGSISELDWIGLLQDKVNISVAIIPMAQDFGWSPTVSGLVQSSFFYGYALTQIPGGYVTSLIGGRSVLPAGVSLWSAATAAVPLLAGTIPGKSRCTPSHIIYDCVSWAYRFLCPE
jgi:hypothetical protein